MKALCPAQLPNLRRCPISTSNCTTDFLPHIAVHPCLRDNLAGSICSPRHSPPMSSTTRFGAASPASAGARSERLVRVCRRPAKRRVHCSAVADADIASPAKAQDRVCTAPVTRHSPKLPIPGLVRHNACLHKHIPRACQTRLSRAPAFGFAFSSAAQAHQLATPDVSTRARTSAQVALCQQLCAASGAAV